MLRMDGQVIAYVVPVQTRLRSVRLGIEADRAIEINRQAVDVAKYGPPPKAA